MMHIEGNVEPGFESIKERFAKEMHTKAEDSAQLCIYHQGKKVVDLWASKHNNFSPDSLINIFSSGKSLEAIALAHLVDKGLLDYDAKIADYWPEFANNNKGELRVADLMRHEAGLVDFNHTLDPDQLVSDRIKENAIGSIIEKLPARISSDPDFKRNYHALTRGWVANEIFRRVEPNGRTLGEYVREELAEALDADVYVGLKDDELERRQHLHGLSIGFQILESFKPRFLGRKVAYSIGQLLALTFPILKRALKAYRKSKNKRKQYQEKPIENQSPENKSLENNEDREKTRKGPTMPLKGFNPLKDREKAINFFNKDIVAQGESSSFNANCSARGLAKVAAMMSAKGQFDNKQFFSEASWQALHDKAVSAKLGGNVTTHFTQGGLNYFSMVGTTSGSSDRSLNQGREGFYGWMGLGGSIFQWHPEKQIGFAFVPTSMHVVDLFNERGKVYQEEVLRCIK